MSCFMGCWQVYIINCFSFFKALEEQVSQEESSSQALREEVLAKEQNVLELRTAMKEVRLNPALQIHSCFQKNQIKMKRCLKPANC